VSAIAVGHPSVWLAACLGSDPLQSTSSSEAGAAEASSTTDASSSKLDVPDAVTLADASIDSAPDPACVPPSPPTTLLAHSEFGFRGVQGDCGWSYRSAPPSITSLATVLAFFNGAEWKISDGGAAHLSRTGGHSSTQDWMVRRWVSTYTGNIRIRGRVTASQAASGNGLRFLIFRNTTGITSYDLVAGANDKTIDVGLTIAQGDNLDFAIDAKASDAYYDSVVYSLELARD
jgi:hypothetical protein